MKNDKLIAIRIPSELNEQIDNLALDEGRSRSGMIRRMLDSYIESYYGGEISV
jgi:predicted DNA-binding protein